jgi:hypothetical protein
VNIMIVSNLDGSSRAINTVVKYSQVAKELGHEVAVYGEQRSDITAVPYTLDVGLFDYAIFVVYEPRDFPDLPYLARLLDGMPRQRRIIIDCTGRYNETTRVDHDFNHLERIDGHQGWEWIEGFQAVSDCILQPTLTPQRDDVRPFLFHGYDPTAVRRPYASAAEAARAWSATQNSAKPYGLIYVGNNWFRWDQIRRLLEAIEPIKEQVGKIHLVGWVWDQPLDWAQEHGLKGFDVDIDLLERLGVETRWGIPYHEVVDYVGQARFSPIIHRPLFNHLGLVTNRTFETFSSDTMPLMMLPEPLLDAIYPPETRLLVPGEDVAAWFQDAMRRPEVYWDAVLKTRDHLALHHSFRHRFEELLQILEP